MEPQFDFGEALKRMKAGKTVRREGWLPNGRKLYVSTGDETSLDYIELITDHAEYVPWVAPHADLLAVDWVEEY